jgi:hypothetical protein
LIFSCRSRQRDYALDARFVFQARLNRV